MKNVVIAGYKRSPFQFAKKGQFAKVRADDLAAQVVKSLVDETKVNPNDIEDLILGCAFPEGEQGFNLARILVFMAGFPERIAGTTVNRFCGSSMQSIHQAAGAIAMGAGEVFICAGVESMSRVPMMGFNPSPNPKIYQDTPDVYLNMGDTAENVAKDYNVSRKDMEELAVLSHKKAAQAQSQGHFKDEITPINGVSEDGCIRPETTLESLGQLKPAFQATGLVTAGTSSPLTDGASAVLVCSEDYADRNGLSKIARIKSVAVDGCAPGIMGIGPIGASKKALERANLKASDLDVIELNEAFSSQALACINELGLDMDKVNIDGGAISLGHPLGATGARIVGKAAILLKRTGGKYSLSSQCIGGGQGIATVLEAI